MKNIMRGSLLPNSKEGLYLEAANQLLIRVTSNLL